MLLTKYFSSLDNNNKKPTPPKLDDMANGDNLVPLEGIQVDMDDDLTMDAIDPDLQVELERLQIERLKLQQAQILCKQRMLIKQAKRGVTAGQTTQPNSICMLPDGKVVVRKAPESSIEHRDVDGSFSAGAGDSLKIPALQREGLRTCVACGASADAFCARCGVTPYCSSRCQRRDWHGRHSSVCHNLARMKAPLDVDDAPEIDLNISAPAPLRRPRSPPREAPALREDRDDTGSDRASKKFTAPGNHSVLKSAQAQGQRNQPSGNRNSNNRPNFNQFDKPNRQFDSSDKPTRKLDKSDRYNRPDRQGQDGGRPALRRPQGVNDDEDRRDAGQYYSNSQQHYRRPQHIQYSDGYPDDGDWDTSRPEPKPIPQAKEEPKPSPVKPPVKETPIVRANRVEQAPVPANQRAAPPANQNAAKSPPTNTKPPASAADLTPTRKLVPKNCLIELLSKGDDVVLSVESLASECHTKATGFVCVSLNEKYGADYEALCESYGADCEAEAPYTPSAGEVFSYLNAEDGGWYRARLVSAAHCALLDAGRVLPAGGARAVRLPARFEHTPEFTALLQADVKVGDNLRGVLLEKTANGWKVELEKADGSGTRVGEGEISRWLPTVQYPAPTASVAPVIPEVARPDVTNNSSVLMVHVTDTNNVYIRPSDAAATRAFDAVLHDVAVFGLNATPLSEPPAAGSYVISKYSDDLHYRALVKRTSVKQNKYLLEYIEYGNSHINTLENLYPLPDNLHPNKIAAMTSCVALVMTSRQPLTPPAEKYLDSLKEGEVELVLTLPNGSKTAPNGSEVTLAVSSNKENVNRKVQEMCTPEWEKLQQRGGDVLETEHLMYQNLEFLALPPAPCSLVVTDVSALMGGTLSVCPAMPDIHEKLANITDRMAKYCESELGREPYLPKLEELCIAQMPPYPQWFRAAFADHELGKPTASVCYIDYGNLDAVPVSLLRKMLPEFMRDLPAIASTVEITDFPKKPTADMLERALAYLNLDDEGRGTIKVTCCEKDGEGLYTVDAPELLQAMLEAA